MNNRLIFAILISVFLIGMILSPVSASQTYDIGDYSFTLADDIYDEIEYVKKYNTAFTPFSVPINKYKTYNVPKYKIKKIKKYKWKYKKVITEKITKYPYTGVKGESLSKYYKKGWKKHSQGSGTYKHSKKYLGYNYVYLKKKTGYKTIKQYTKVGTKKLKVPVYVYINCWETDDGETLVRAQLYVLSDNFVYYSKYGKKRNYLYKLLDYTYL